MGVPTQPVIISPEQQRVIDSASWGAAIFGFIYLIWMNAQTHALIALLGSAVPGVNIVAWMYYVMKGKQLAWQFRKWKGFDDFLSCQRIWDRWAKRVFAIVLAFGVLIVVLILYQLTVHHALGIIQQGMSRNL